MGTSRWRDDRRNNDLPRKPALGSVLGGTHELRGAICEPAQAPLTAPDSPAPATTGTVRLSVRLRTPRPLSRTRWPGARPANSTLRVGRALRSIMGIQSLWANANRRSWSPPSEAARWNAARNLEPRIYRWCPGHECQMLKRHHLERHSVLISRSIRATNREATACRGTLGICRNPERGVLRGPRSEACRPCGLEFRLDSLTRG